MKLAPVAGPGLAGKVSIKPPAGEDSILQLLKKRK
eukprot:COSAG03_NODE_517_length_7253_cov_51.415152_7_plen_35_part_00